MSNGKGYAARHLEHNDYYNEQERVQGQWHGRGAELLGLEGEVKQEQFEAVRRGLNPDTGEFLRQRRSADRLAQDGTTKSKGRNLYDFTISAPKSVSILAGPGGDDRLLEAHDKAVAEALKELEACAAVRVRRDGANHDRTTGNLVIATYRHDTSRELDPQIHTHAVAANMTWDGVEDRWKALQASGIYDRREYLTEVYRNALAREVQSLGYEIEDRRNSRGRDCGFEIRGISEELLEKYSQRSEQRDRAVADFTRKNGRAPTDNEVAVLVRETRSDKLVEITTAEVKERQLARLSIEESHSLAEVRSEALRHGVSGYRQEASPSLHHAKDHTFERVSVARDYELLTEALRHGRGHIDLAELRGVLHNEEARGELLRAGSDIATRGSLAREQEMVARVNQGMGRHERLGGGHEFRVSDRLRPEQKRVVETVLNSRDLAVNIRGAAGTGKTTTLEELHRGLKESGRQVRAVAPTMTAIEELQKVGFEDAITIERLLQDRQAQQELRGKVLIVDEAGMISARQMSEVLRVADEQSARVVFSGDTRQIQSVEAGDALRILERESRLQSVALTQVQRQTRREYRAAVEELRNDPERGFEQLEHMGAVQEVPQEERARAAAEKYAQYQERTNARGQRASVLTVCWTHEEVGRTTEAIREDLKRAGHLGEGVRVHRHESLNWTEAQRRDPRNYKPGQVLEFHRGVKGIEKNEVLEVDRVEAGRVIARNQRGEERAIAAKQAGCFSVHQKREVEVAANDRLLLTSNRRQEGFRATNGELVTVRSVDRDGRIALVDGRTLPSSYRQFNHGYAVTAHRSQAKTVDFVVVSTDAMQKELFYVAATRGREGIAIVTSDRESLRESVCRSGERRSAMELAREAGGSKALRPGLQRGEHRGMEAAREQAQHGMRQEWPDTGQARNRAQGREQETRVEPRQEQAIAPRGQQNKRENEISNEVGFGF